MEFGVVDGSFVIANVLIEPIGIYAVVAINSQSVLFLLMCCSWVLEQPYPGDGLQIRYVSISLPSTYFIGNVFFDEMQ